MKTCPNCGHENNENDRFCANCGTRLTPVAPPRAEPTEEPVPSAEEPAEQHQPEVQEESLPPQSTIPPAVTPSFTQPGNEWERNHEPVDDEWKMSDLGPPPGNKRRTWLWIIIAILAVLVLSCCGFLFWISATDAGSSWFNDLATKVSEEATKQAQ